MRQVIRNLSYQTIYQILSILCSFLVSPYISRTIGPKGLGEYSFTYSIVNYFLLFAMFGISNYGSRSIVTVKNDKTILSQIFWEIYFMKIVFSLIALVSYSIIVINAEVYRNIMLLQAIWILACATDVSWYYNGIENFRVTAISGIIIKIFTVILIFSFVRNEEDLWIYIVILSTSTLLNHLVLWPTLISHIEWNVPAVKSIIGHIKPCFSLFAPFLALSIYHTIDKTMLGLFSEPGQSGYYYNTDKLFSIPFSVINAIGVVMLPRMTNLLSHGEDNEWKLSFNRTIEWVMFVSVPIALGISSVAPDFIPFYFGAGYDPCVDLVYIFSGIMIFKVLSNIIRDQYLIPSYQEKYYTYAVFFSLWINVILNYCFLAVLCMGAMGAALGTLAAEFSTLLILALLIQERKKVFRPVWQSFKYFIPGVFMMIGVKLFQSYYSPGIIRLLAEIGIGAAAYAIASVNFLKRIY